MRTPVTTVCIAAAVVMSSSAVRSQPAARSRWDGWQFMQGKWIGEGTSEAGRGSGYFTFEPDLDGKVWVRRNHAEYPGAGSAPPTIHDDLMVVYTDAATDQTRAFYTDTEGHTIGYVVSVSADRNALTFVSDRQSGQPRYRLTYVRLDPTRMSVVLETAPPDRPEEFRKIVEGFVRKSESK